MTLKTPGSFRLGCIQAFGYVVEYHSQTAAARELGCDQATVSRSIGELNDFLGGKVFEGTKTLKLTPLGEAFVPKAVEMMALVRECRKLNAKIMARAADQAPSPTPTGKRRGIFRWLGLSSDTVEGRPAG